MFMEKTILKKVVLENFMCYAHAEFDLCHYKDYG